MRGVNEGVDILRCGCGLVCRGYGFEDLTRFDGRNNVEGRELIYALMCGLVCKFAFPQAHCCCAEHLSSLHRSFTQLSRNSRFIPHFILL